MKSETFNLVLQQTIEQLQATLKAKGGEYARDIDLLSNFKQAAGALATTPEQALVGMWIKHVVSIADLTSKIHPSRATLQEIWLEKIGDAIAYMVLLRALLTERYGWTVQTTQDKRRYEVHPSIDDSSYPQE